MWLMGLKDDFKKALRRVEQVTWSLKEAWLVR
jgi:hypothetical protein